MPIDDIYQQCIERIITAKRILLVTHISPDGDALGSLCFMMAWLDMLKKPYSAYTAGPLPSTLSFLPGYDLICLDKKDLPVSECDLIISLDCGNVARTGLVSEISGRRSDQFFIEIDHHPSVERVSDLEIRDSSAASTTEILQAIAHRAGLRLNPVMSQCLLTGISTDTANFRFSATSNKTIAAASRMLLGGASLSKIVDRTWRTKSLPDLKLWGTALSRLERLERYNIAYTVITQEDFAATASDEEAMEGLAEFISSLPDVAAILVLRDDGRGFVRGNWRTIRDDIDVGALARTLGGGGHRKAAGFALPGRLIRWEGGWQVEN